MGEPRRVALDLQRNLTLLDKPGFLMQGEDWRPSSPVHFALVFTKLSFQLVKEMELETVAGSFGQKPKDAGKKENFWSRASKGVLVCLRALVCLWVFPRNRLVWNHQHSACWEHDHRIGPASAWWGQCVCAQLCLTLCDPMNYSLSGSSVHGISQSRILEWVAISFSRGSSWPRTQGLNPGLLH